MSVDVTSEIVIRSPLSEVADYAANPLNAQIWSGNVRSVNWLTEPPLQVGSAITFTASFLGRQMSYTYQVIEFEPHARLIMRSSDALFEMETTFIWTATSQTTTRMTLRNYGEPAGFFKIASPVISIAMQRAMTQDLTKLKDILENK